MRCQFMEELAIDYDVRCLVPSEIVDGFTPSKVDDVFRYFW